MSLRERIEAEQKGKSISPISERFETGVSRTASLLAHFTEEQAEIRLVTDEEIGDFGIGKPHLNESLKRLALINPKFDEPDDFFFEKSRRNFI